MSESMDDGGAVVRLCKKPPLSSAAAQSMAIGNLPSFDLVESVLRQLGAAEGPTEAHGSLCGFTCILGQRAGASWVASLSIEPPLPADVLHDLATATSAALADGGMTFMPLLPADEAPLTLRASALAEWCAGFMHGLGEAAGSGPARDVIERAVTREIMDDFAEIARVTLGDDETDLEAEAAYVELVEFVRVSVQLVFEELHEVRRSVATARVH